MRNMIHRIEHVAEAGNRVVKVIGEPNWLPSGAFRVTCVRPEYGASETTVSTNPGTRNDKGALLAFCEPASPWPCAQKHAINQSPAA